MKIRSFKKPTNLALIAAFAAAVSFFTIVPTAIAEAKPMECKMTTPFEMDFKSDKTTRRWQAVNDGVMGGRSSGGPDFKNGNMIFAGTINTNGGGFSSVRTRMSPGDLADADHIKLRIKSDGRAYKLTFRTNARYGWRPLSFQNIFPTVVPGKWQEVMIPLDGLEASIFGRPVAGAIFDKREVVEMGIILADGQDGPFAIEIDWLRACTTSS